MQIAGNTKHLSANAGLVFIAPAVSLAVVLTLLVPLAPGPESVNVFRRPGRAPWTGPWWAAGEPAALHWSFLSMLLLAALIGLAGWFVAGWEHPVPQRWRLSFAVVTGLVVWLSPTLIALAFVPHRAGTSQMIPINVYSLILPVLLAIAWHRAMGSEVHQVAQNRLHQRLMLVIGFTAMLVAVILLLFIALLMLGFID